ncbi:MAG: hypothetical protein UV65_C0001G0027 [Parcubacteria group bacterium GW2011_GWF2_43_11]|nr:MAG: hypothetical protein UV65_C0001G0027 [Parcubacteria group bacterium GW2011_GWF2_43_11]
MENEKKPEKSKDECPLCRVSEETLKILKEKGGKNNLKEKPKSNGK